MIIDLTSQLKPKRFVFCTAMIASIFSMAPANAEIETTFNTTLSYGISKRMESQDPALIGPGNLADGTGATVTAEDGNLNFDKGDIFSNAIKGSSELQIDGDTHGAFVRVKYWQDMALEGKKFAHGHDNNDWAPDSKLDDGDFNDYAKFSGFEFLDAFVYGSYEVGDKPVDVRLGRQVVNWGENIFFFGVNQVNPIDVSAVRRPGFEVKEALLPVNMLYASIGATDNLNVSAFYQLEWEKTPIDGCGTYFSSVDFVAEGCDRALVGGGAGLSDIQSAALASVARDPNDLEPDDNGQFGLALRYYADSVDTEFGFYYQNLHSRTPVLSVRYSADAVADGTVLSGTPAPAYYRVDYPEDTKIIGASLSTTLGTVAFGAEMSIKKDVAIGINGNAILKGGLGALAGACAAPDPGALIGPFADKSCPALAEFGATGDGVALGYDLFDVYQVQMSGIQLINQTMGASSLVLLGELAFIHVSGLGDDMPYGRNPVFGDPLALDPVNGSDDGLVTDNSWGYRARAVWTYPNAFAGVELSPFVALSHDVDGTSPGPTFDEGRKSYGVGINASYQSKYRAGLSYTTFDGGLANAIEDRDFMSLNVSMDF